MKADVLLKLGKIFEDNGWEKDTELFNRFTKRIDLLQKDEMVELFLELTKRFLWVKLEDYPRYVETLLRQAIEHIPQHQKKIYVVSSKSIINIPNEKSGDMVSYIARSLECKLSDMHKSINTYSGMFFCPNEVIQENKKIVLLDDFIGSGDSAMQVIKEAKFFGVQEENIILATIAIMEDGKKRIMSKGIDVKYIFSCQKGISDYYSGGDLIRYKRIITEMGSALGIKKDVVLGYKDSEALVSMFRTPNNTFPVFWCRANEQEGPFRR